MSDHAEQLERERRGSRPAGIAALLSGVLTAGFVFSTQAITRGHDVSGAGDNLRFFAQHKGEFVAPFLMRSLSFFLLVPVVLYLYDATKYRHPKMPSSARVMGLAGAIGLGIATLLAYVGQRKAGDDFLQLGLLSPDQYDSRADDILGKHTAFQISSFVLLAGTLSLAFWLILNNLNAVRSGLLTKFMGYLGVALGPALVLLPFTPIILAGWLIGLGMLFLGLLRRGRPPAWATGEEIPWPSRADRYRTAAEGDGEGSVVEGTATEPATAVAGNGEPPRPVAGEVAAGDGAAERPRRRKRKRR